MQFQPNFKASNKESKPRVLLDLEEAGFMTCTAASQQMAIKMIWLHFYGAVMSSIFIYSLWLSLVSEMNPSELVLEVK